MPVSRFVEVVRDAGGELADRVHLLRLAQTFLGTLAPQLLLVQAFESIGLAHGTPRGDYRQAEQRQRGGDAEDQVRGHAADPGVPDGLGRVAVGDVDRQVGQLAVHEETTDAVEAGPVGGIEAGIRPLGDGPHEAGLGGKPGRTAAGGIAHQDLAIAAHDRGGEALGVRRLGELLEEIARRDRHGDHAVEAAVQPLAALAVLEELDILQPPAQRFAHVTLHAAVAVGGKIGAIAIAQPGRHGEDLGCHQGLAILVHHPDVFDLGQRIDQALDAFVNLPLVRPDRGVGVIVDQFGDVGSDQVVGLERGANVYVEQIERPREALLSLFLGVLVGEPAGAGEQQQRHDESGHRQHHRDFGRRAAAQPPSASAKEPPHRPFQSLAISDATNLESSTALYGLGKT